MTSRKAYIPRFKAAGADGTASWVMAAFNEIDLDGDVTVPGAFGRQTFSIVPAHDSTHVPLGKGAVYETATEAIVDAKFNLEIPAARDWHSAIMFDLANPPAVQEYSYAYSIRPGGSKLGTFRGSKVRFLQPLPDGTPGVEVFESSPVLRGAGVGTRTLAAKASRADLEAAESARREFLRFVARSAGIPDPAGNDHEFLRFVRGGLS